MAGNEGLRSDSILEKPNIHTHINHVIYIKYDTYVYMHTTSREAPTGRDPYRSLILLLPVSNGIWCKTNSLGFVFLFLKWK